MCGEKRVQSGKRKRKRKEEREKEREKKIGGGGGESCLVSRLIKQARPFVHAQKVVDAERSGQVLQ